MQEDLNLLRNKLTEIIQSDNKSSVSNFYRINRNEYSIEHIFVNQTQTFFIN